MAIIALFGALALFWLSTRQFALIWRAVIWVIGAGVLAWITFNPGRTPSEQFGLWRAVEELLNADRPDDASVVQALRNNAATVAQFIPQLLDFFLFAGGVMAALTALSFTRGERLERALRPAILGLIGFIAGSTATLAVVAIGLGGQVKPQTYIGRVTERTMGGEDSVYDGDTFTLGEVSLRLWGVDAPELHQRCRQPDGGWEECGETARIQLRSLITNELVQCDRTPSLNSGRTETFGRPLVKCRVIGGIGDISGEMIRLGYAIPYENNAEYGYHDEAGEGAGQNLMASCSLQPDVWRSRDGRSARHAFESGAAPEQEHAMGICSSGQAAQ